MKYIINILLLGFSLWALTPEKLYGQSPLAYFSTVWNDAKYEACNTADHAYYLSAKERQVIYILNLARMDPKLFCETVVKKYPDIADEPGMESSAYYKSLVAWLPALSPMGALEPDSLCFVSAHCHAAGSGVSGYAGHDRTKECRAVSRFKGECCDYGNAEPLDILMSLFIDDGVPSLGHRKICFDARYKVVGISIQPHIKYGTNTVLDFLY